jgi:iron(III) transport system substrate-binding protein
MVEADFVWAADNRARIIAEWTRRYGSKAAPKN